MEIKNTTQINRIVYREFCSRLQKWKSLIWWGVACMAAMFVFAGISVFLEDKTGEPMKEMDYAIAIFFIIGFFFFLMRGLYALNYRNHLKSNRVISNGITQHFTFTAEEGRCVSESDGKVIEDVSINYRTLYRVIETDEYFYLFINNAQAQIVSKMGFEQGNEDELRGILICFVPSKKYKTTARQKRKNARASR